MVCNAYVKTRINSRVSFWLVRRNAFVWPECFTLLGFFTIASLKCHFFKKNKNMINLDNCQFLRLLLVQLTSQYCKMHPTRMITRKCGLDVFTTWGKKCIKIKLRITGLWDYAFQGPFLWRKLCWGSQQDHYMFLGNCPPTPPLSQH